jgi:aldehyde:ferredoxin oxidoreductase
MAMSRLLRVDVGSERVRFLDVPEKYSLLGGRALTSSLVRDEVPPACHPLRRHNRIVIAPGLLSGTKAPCSGRVSVGGKSPLTGTIKEANGGGITSQKVARLGIKAVIIEGMPDGDKTSILLVGNGRAELVPAKELRHLGTYELSQILRDRYGKSVGLVSIGPAGEMRMLAAGVANNDNEGEPSRYAARGGLGAVLGSKGIKAIVIDEGDSETVKPKNRQGFDSAVKVFTKALLSHPVTTQALPMAGTAGTIDPINEVGGLPTRSFREGRFEGASKVSGWHMAKVVEQRGGKGKMGHPCHPGCIIRCSNIYPDECGNVLVSPLEYETDWALGPNLGIDNLDHVAMLNRICNDVGLDTIETGCTLGVLMDAGVLEFGDGQGTIRLLQEVAKGTPMGRLIGAGCAVAGKVYGVTRVPAVKNQGLAAYDPRAIKGIGVTFATGTMGADHTFGYTVSPEVFKVGGNLDPLSPVGKAEASKDAQVYTAFIDSTGLCLFVTFATADNEEAANSIIHMVNATHGVDWTLKDVLDYGRRVLSLERQFNAEAGFTNAHDRLPEFLYEEKLPPHNHVFDVPDNELDSVYMPGGAT